MKSTTLIMLVTSLSGCAHWDSFFQEKSYSCSEKAMRWNKLTREYELRPKNDLCFETDVRDMKHSLE